MRRSIYVAGAEQGSGKSIIALALMELGTSRGGKIGFFRPLERAVTDPDPVVALIQRRYQLRPDRDLMFGCDVDEARELIAADRYSELLKRVLAQFKRLQRNCDQVLCLGTDYSRAPSALEFDFNADLANHLGCLILPVVRGHRREVAETVEATIAFQEALEGRRCDILATVVNRVSPEHASDVAARLAAAQSDHVHYVVPNLPSLAQPTVADIVRGLGAAVIWGDGDDLNRNVAGYKVAAMQLPDFLEHVDDGDLIITPGDRADIVVGSLLSYPSRAYPQIAGLLLTGGLPVAPQIRQLIEGLGGPPVAVLAVNNDTFATAMTVSGIEPSLAPDNERRIAAALGLVEHSIDTEGLAQRIATTRSTRVTPLMFEYDLLHQARSQRQHIVLPEGTEDRILRAAEILRLRDVADLTLLGDRDAVRARTDSLGLRLDDVRIIDPVTSEWRDDFARIYYDLRKHKGISQQMAYDQLADVSYFGTMMVHRGYADGMVSGAVHTTQHTIRPAFEFIRTRPGASLISSVFFMCLADRVLVYGDCAVNPNPTAEQLADIAITSAETALAFGIEPRVAMLSYSTGESGKGEDVERVRVATGLVRERRPDLNVEGPIQYDAAVDASVAETKMPDSAVAGQATVFIFPDLNTGNNTYKAVQRSAGAIAIGPVLQGLNKPVNDLSRGCTVPDIVNTVAITAIQAQIKGTST